MFNRKALRLELDEAGEKDLKRLLATLVAEIGAIQAASKARQHEVGARVRHTGVAIFSRRPRDE